LTIVEEIGTRAQRVVALAGLADAERAAGRLDDAEKVAEDALDLARRYGYRGLEGIALTVVAGVHADRGHPEPAVRLAAAAAQLHAETGHRAGAAAATALLERYRNRG
jgi:hypothetical protein